MGIFDMTDNFMESINQEGYIPENTDQYINGVKEHSQPLVTFTNEGKNVIYREQL